MTQSGAAPEPGPATAPGRETAPGPEAAPGRETPLDPATTALPVDPEAYDSPRATQARARGLAAPYIAGGEDPNPERTRREERRYRILLVAMIVAVVLLGFVLGILQNIFGF